MGDSTIPVIEVPGLEPTAALSTEDIPTRLLSSIANPEPKIWPSSTDAQRTAVLATPEQADESRAKRYKKRPAAITIAVAATALAAALIVVLLSYHGAAPPTGDSPGGSIISPTPSPTVATGSVLPPISSSVPPGRGHGKGHGNGKNH